MVHGLFIMLHFPYMQFPCLKFHGYELYNLFWQSVKHLERCGFNVWGCTFDELFVNLQFIKMHCNCSKFVNKTIDPYAMEEQKPLFILRPTSPHQNRNSWCSNTMLMWVTKFYSEKKGGNEFISSNACILYFDDNKHFE